MNEAHGTALAERPVAMVGMTLEEAAGFLHPPMTREQLARIVSQLPNFRPVGHRPTRGRPVPLYSAAELMDLHHHLRGWLL